MKKIYTIILTISLSTGINSFSMSNDVKDQNNVIICGFCRDDLTTQDKASLACKHEFCLKCINNWFIRNKENPKCPMCSRIVDAFDKNLLDPYQSFSTQELAAAEIDDFNERPIREVTQADFNKFILIKVMGGCLGLGLLFMTINFLSGGYKNFY